MTSDPVPSPVLRALDANLDRTREGLRVLEDVARFILDDATLSGQLRELRHRVSHAAGTLEPALLGARRAEEDVGANPALPEEPRQSLADLVQANAKRTQEALRVLEEFSRLPELPTGQAGLPRAMDTAQFKAARFDVYDMEQRLVGRLLRRDKIEKLKGLYVLIDPTATDGRPELQVAELALEGGATVLQLRDKVREKGIQLDAAQGLRQLCDEHGALLIINNDPDLARAVKADGVHLGQRDFPVQVAREILPVDCIIGVSAATLDEARQAETNGADYIAVGSIYPTNSKEDTRPAGLETLRRVREMTTRPLVAIGGITEENVEAVMAAGADAVAVISAVCSAADPKVAAHRLLDKMRGHREPTSQPA
ncbi:MAG: thiamine phosphate synthase [Chloroflexi bacterium]|nr:thiamine phosphate synthase [Chloroflexota bacterium]